MICNALFAWNSLIQTFDDCRRLGQLTEHFLVQRLWGRGRVLWHHLPDLLHDVSLSGPAQIHRGPATHKQKHSHLWFETHYGWNEVIPPQRGLGLSWHLLLGLEKLLQGLGIILNLLPGFEVFVGDVRKLLHIFLLSALDVPDQASEVDAVTANKPTTLSLWKHLEWRTYFEDWNLLTNRSCCRETFPPQLRCGLPRRPWYLPQANASETPQTPGNTKVENVSTTLKEVGSKKQNQNELWQYCWVIVTLPGCSSKQAAGFGSSRIRFSSLDWHDLHQNP